MSTVGPQEAIADAVLDLPDASPNEVAALAMENLRKHGYGVVDLSQPGAATWRQRIGRALGARLGVILPTLDEACERIEELQSKAGR